MYNILAKLNDNYGYDPYNHVGCHMQPVLKPLDNKIFVMSPKMLDIFRKEIIQMSNSPNIFDSYKYMVKNPRIIASNIFTSHV